MTRSRRWDGWTEPNSAGVWVTIVVSAIWALSILLLPVALIYFLLTH